MRIVAIAALGVLVTTAGARADQREDLQAKGEQLAKEGRFSEAVDQFKAADRIQPRASHACLIALAYTRVEHWPQAELYLSLCHKRANATDPLPDWVPQAEKQLADRLAAANVAPVTVVVTPATAAARITVSSFAPDEVFEPQTIHLPVGTHVIFARAEGFSDKQATVEIKDKTPKTVTIDLAGSAAVGGGGDTPHREIPPPAETHPSKTGTYVMIGGGAVALVGVGAHIVMAMKRNEINEPGHDYQTDVDTFHQWRAITIGSYGVGAALLVTGYLLNRRAHAESSVAVSAAPLAEGGAFVSVGWTR